MKTIIVDLDGTIALNEHRQHLVNGTQNKKAQWREFFLASEYDLPNIPVIEIMRALHQQNYIIHIFSGRSEIVKNITIEWLEKHQIPYDKLTMRTKSDRTADEILKKSWLLNYYPNYQDTVLGVLDDSVIPPFLTLVKNRIPFLNSL